MKKTSLFIMAAALLAAACDKIEPNADGNYATFAGSSATWVDGTPVANPVQHAYVEKFTGPRCINCPAADRTLDAAHEQFHDLLVLVSVNSSQESFGAPGPNSPDMRTDDGAIWEEYWGKPGLPAAFINRVDKMYDGSMTTISTDIQTVTDSDPVVALEGSVSGSSTLSIDINLQFLQEYTDPVTLTLVLTQDSLAYWQMDGTRPVTDYVHNHMLRDVITDVWGADIECTGAAGECRKATFSYSLPEGVDRNWNIVALVSDKATRRVLNSVVCE